MLIKKDPMAGNGEITESTERESHILFRHQDLVKFLKSANKINRKNLTNTINHIHFTGGRLWVHLKDPQYEEDILVKVYPEPCTGETITCKWSEENKTSFGHYRFLNLLIDDGMTAILVPVKSLRIDGNYFSINLPEAGQALKNRQARRYTSQGVTAEITQSGFLASGCLLNFSPFSFRVRVAPGHGGTFHWLNVDEPLVLRLYRDEKIIFSESCRFINQTGSMSVKEIVVAPIIDQIKRFRSRKIRSPRTRLAPSSSITFEHPFSGKPMQLDLHDISVTGFSIHEREDECALVPGMIINSININYSGILAMPCTAQVIYRRKEKGGVFRCGMAILDMGIVTYGKLNNILGNILDSKIHVSERINMDVLWNFLFDSGFIYPKKYHFIQPYKDSIKETYRKLYQEMPEIAAHMTYQENGCIYGHVSMVKAYERSWMVHHLAAKPVPGARTRTGISLLKQIIHYFEGFYRLPAYKMDYWICYYRPSTRFMDLFFGDFARHFRNPRACSLDLFAYKDCSTASSQENLPDGWSLREYSNSDFRELDRFYRNRSGGLLPDILYPQYSHSNDETLEETYKRYGLVRKMKIYSLVHGEKLKAVLVVNQSDLGLNMSELLNGIKIIITDPEYLPWDILSSAIDGLTDVYELEKIPILVYPHSYLENKDIPYDKQYVMFVMDMQYGKEFLDYLKGRLKTKLRFFIRFLIKRYFNT